jgi:hypothetical protein
MATEGALDEIDLNSARRRVLDTVDYECDRPSASRAPSWTFLVTSWDRSAELSDSATFFISAASRWAFYPASGIASN